MNKRLLVIFAVFVVGFTVGYGATTLVVSGPGPTRSASPEPISPQSGASDATTAAAARPAESPSGEPSAPIPDPGAASTREAALEVDAATQPTDTGEAASPVDPAGGDAAATTPDEAPPGEGDGEAVAPKPAVKGPWWERCLDKRCRVDFGSVSGGLTIRKGHLEHGEEIVWRERFGNAKRLGLLPARDDLIVELHGVGMTHGLPSVAYITWREPKGDAKTGIISLNIGEKVVTLVPLEGGQVGDR